MMEIARRHLESQGAYVLGGYLSPSHDDYVSVKCQGESLPAAHRLRLCEEQVADSDWLMADGWEALGVERALNFTDVVERLQNYLSRHVHSHRPIHVVYAFGSDNARFAPAFHARGRCVCVLRPGFEEAFTKYGARYRGHERILFAEEQSHPISSRDVRKGRSQLIAGSRADWLYRTWTDSLTGTRAVSAIAMTYFLRDEGGWLLEPWQLSYDIAVLERAWQRFTTGLKDLFVEAHSRAVAPDQRFDIVVRRLEIQNQRQQLASLTQGESVISLDPCLPGQFNLVPFHTEFDWFNPS